MEQIQPHVYSFEKLVQETVTASMKLLEYFRLNLIYEQLVSGKGLDFDRIREFQTGDEPKRIDWKVFAKSEKLMTRNFKEERRFDIVIVLDVSDSMLLGTTGQTKNEYASIVLGALAYAATEAGDNVAVVMVSDKVAVATDPSADYTEALHVVAQKENYGGKKDWNNLVMNIIGNYADDAIIFVLSDFIETNPDTFLPELSTNFARVYGIMIRDPVDIALPKKVGRMYLRDTLNNKKYLTNLEQVREEYAVLARQEIEHIENKFHEAGQLFFKVSTDEDFASGFIRALGAEKVEIS